MVFTDRDIHFLIDKDLFEEVKPICVNFIKSVGGSGFTTYIEPGSECGLRRFLWLLRFYL